MIGLSGAWWKEGELFKRGVVEDVSVCLIRCDAIKGRITGSNDCDGPGDDVCTVEIAEVVAVTEGLELLHHHGPGDLRLLLEVDEQDQGL